MSEVRVGEWSGVENRRHRRVTLQVPIECRSGQQVFLAKGENISISGLLVRCSDPFPQDSEINVSFTLPGSTEAISTVARVAHFVPGVFMGLELTGLTPEARTQINQYVASADPAATVM
jgi:PilZ domain